MYAHTSADDLLGHLGKHQDTGRLGRSGRTPSTRSLITWLLKHPFAHPLTRLLAYSFVFTWTSPHKSTERRSLRTRMSKTQVTKHFTIDLDLSFLTHFGHQLLNRDSLHTLALTAVYRTP